MVQQGFLATLCPKGLAAQAEWGLNGCEVLEVIVNKCIKHISALSMRGRSATQKVFKLFLQPKNTDQLSSSNRHFTTLARIYFM
jgi:hypothetical protein